MFKCYCQCCKNNFQVSGAVYVSILNETHFPIFFIVQYTLNDRTYTKYSRVFGLGQSDKIVLSTQVTNICFNVLNNSTNPPGFICNVALPCTMISCYKLVETLSGLQLIRIPG